MASTVYLTNIARVSAVRAGSPRHAHEVGPGQVVGIMRFWPAWARAMALGHVVGLMPTAGELAALRCGSVTFAAYAGVLRERWMTRACAGAYAPGELRMGWLEETPHGAHLWDGSWWRPGPLVEDGATLCCGCADATRCHRSVAAEVLAASGWRVVLDGVHLHGDEGGGQ